MRFEPTYEELKLPCICCVGIVRTGFEPTYEELKHPPRLPVRQALVMF